MTCTDCPRPPETGDAARKRILFVDDEPRILEGLKTRLHRQRRKWVMLFAGSGQEALDTLAREHVDVIVSDMRMPEMDGATLLRKVQETHPHVVRVVLSGHAELESSLRALQVAHQFLTKPCEPGLIESVVERACNLHALVEQEAVKKVIGRIGSLPPVPRVYSRLMAALVDEDASTSDIAGIVRMDMAIAAKTLQMVNSAFFRLSRTISRVEEAVAFLGINTIKSMVLAAEVFRETGTKCHPGMSMEALQTHAVLVSSVAASLVHDKGKREDAAIAGLLHDIGKLILASELKEQTGRVLQKMYDTGCTMYEAEESELGATHAEIGAYLLGIWGLPYTIVEAVANHHSPSRADTGTFDALAAVHVADALVYHTASDKSVETSHPEGLDLEYLDSIGALDRVDNWVEEAVALIADLRRAA